MTIKLDLAPELESFARAQAQEQFQGDVAAFITAILQSQMNASEYDEEVEQKLLEAIDSPCEPLTDALWEKMRQRATASSN